MKEDSKESITYGFTGHKDETNIQPYPPTESVNLDPLLEKARQLKLSTEKKQKIYKTVEDDTIEVTADDIDDLVDELEIEAKPSIDLRKKSYEETKKIVDTFRDKMANPPKYMSYEGSMVVCVLLSMESPATVRMKGLPAVDQELVKEIVGKLFDPSYRSISVKFDNNKDFICEYDTEKTSTPFILINTVAHPRGEDICGTPYGDVPIKKDGDKIAVGDSIIIDKKNIKKLMGIESTKDSKKEEPEEDFQSRRQPVSGRNAFELRTDILQLSMDYFTHNKKNMSPDEVVKVAKTFYQFVENKRY
jgi:hypothetical protein